MSHPGEEGWMQEYSGIIADPTPAKWQRERKSRRHRRRGIGYPLFPLATHVSDRFPLELIDRILDYLHSDRRTLSSCSQVCRAWLASSKCRLFRNATVRLSRRVATQFIQLLDAPGSIAYYIRHLEMDEFFLMDPPKDLLRNTDLVSITSLRLHGIRGNATLANAMSLTRNFQALTNFELHSSRLSLAQFLGIVGALPLLQRIGLEDVSLGTKPSSVPNDQHSLSHLRELDFQSRSYVSELLDWLLSYERIPAINKLKWETRFPTASIGRFLSAVGPALEYLSLSDAVCHGYSRSMSFRFKIQLFPS